MAHNNTQTADLRYAASYVGFKRRNLSDEEREAVDAMSDDIDMSFIYASFMGAATLGYKFSVKPVHENWYAADVMMIDKQHPDAGKILRSESDTPEKAIYSLYLKMNDAKWDFKNLPDANMSRVRMTR